MLEDKEQMSTMSTTEIESQRGKLSQGNKVEGKLFIMMLWESTVYMVGIGFGRIKEICEIVPVIKEVVI